MKKILCFSLLTFLLFPLLSCQGTLSFNKEEDVQRLSILQGLTTEKMAYFSILVPSEETYSYFIRSKEKSKTLEKQIQPYKVIDLPLREWRLIHLKVEGLKLDMTYKLKILDALGDIRDKRTFQALDLNKKAVRINIASCMTEASQVEWMDSIWSHFVGEKPDVVFFIGDNIYVDIKKGRGLLQSKEITKKHLWTRYVETFQGLSYFKSSHLYPTLAVWDDHDYGYNNGDRTFHLKKEAKKAFEAFFVRASLENVIEKGPGVSFVFRGFHQSFIFTDNRTFRTPNNKDLAHQTHWGKKQELWIQGLLKKERRPVWLIEGDQFFGKAYPRWESYEVNHPRSFQKMKSWVKGFSYPLVFLSGDRHWTEIMKISKDEVGQDTYELTSSGIQTHLYPPPWDSFPNDRQVVGRASISNYMTVESQVLKKELSLDVKAWEATAHELLFHRELKVTGENP